MDWIKKHVDTTIVLGAIVSSLLWMNGRFNEVDRQFAEVHQELAIMKTVLIMKNIMPVELCKSKDEK